MRRIFSSLIVTVALGAAAASVHAQQSQLLVDADWLKQHLDDPALVLLHVGREPEYAEAHIPGARFITLNDVSIRLDSAAHERGDLMLQLPPAAELRTRLEAFGISDDSRIVVYFGKDWVSPATRVVLTLDYIGLGDRTSLLNGGMQAWERAGGRVVTDVPAPKRGKLSARPVKDIIVDAAFVQSVPARQGFRLIDARAPVYYNGIEPTYEKVGHIPGAVSVPYSAIVDDELMISRERLETLFRDAGVKPGDVVVGYCHIGQQATAMLFAARLLGHDALLYDGSFQDWATRNRGAVEK